MDHNGHHNIIPSFMLGTGICLFPIHNSAITLHSGEETILFLPWIGLLLIITGLIMLYDRNLKSIDPGPKIIYIPMLIIIVSGWLRLAVDFSTTTFANAAFLTCLFLLYTASRKLGLQILYALIPFLLIEAISIIIYAITNSLYQRGGLLGAYNYDIATGWLIIGTGLLLWHPFFRSIPWLFLMTAAAFCIASEELVFASAMIWAFAFLRNDVSFKILATVAIFLIMMVIMATTGFSQKYYDTSRERAENVSLSYTSINDYTHDRIEVDKNAILNTSPLGHGYTASDFTPTTVHLAPLTVSDQLGPVAALSWLFITAYCLLKTTWKYAWVAVISLSLVDHYVWTQMAPFWWILAGLSITVPINDRLFKRQRFSHFVTSLSPAWRYNHEKA